MAASANGDGGVNDDAPILPDAVGSNPQGADDSRETIEIDDDSLSDQPPSRAARVRDSSGSTQELAISLLDSSDEEQETTTARHPFVVPIRKSSIASSSSSASSKSSSNDKSNKNVSPKIPFVAPAWSPRSKLAVKKEESTPFSTSSAAAASSSHIPQDRTSRTQQDKVTVVDLSMDTDNDDSPEIIDLFACSSETDSSDDEAVRKKAASQSSPFRKMIYSHRRRKHLSDDNDDDDDDEHTIPESALGPGRTSKVVTSPPQLPVEEEDDQQTPSRETNIGSSNRAKLTARKTTSFKISPARQTPSVKVQQDTADQEYHPKNIFPSSTAANAAKHSGSRHAPVPTHRLKDPPPTSQPTASTVNYRDLPRGGDSQEFFRQALKNNSVPDVRVGRENATTTNDSMQQSNSAQPLLPASATIVEQQSNTSNQSQHTSRDDSSSSLRQTKNQGVLEKDVNLGNQQGSAEDATARAEQELEQHQDLLVQNLRIMLDETEKMGLSQIISWDFHGRSVVIRDKTLLSTLLVKYFAKNQTSCSQFDDMLLQCGFKRGLNHGKGTDAFSHPHFVKAHPLLWRDGREKAKEQARNEASLSTHVVPNPSQPAKRKKKKQKTHDDNQHLRIPSYIELLAQEKEKKKSDGHRSGNPKTQLQKEPQENNINGNHVDIPVSHPPKIQAESHTPSPNLDGRSSKSPDTLQKMKRDLAAIAPHNKPPVDETSECVEHARRRKATEALWQNQEPDGETGTKHARKTKRKREAKSIASRNLEPSLRDSQMEQDQDEVSDDEVGDLPVMTMIDHLTSLTLDKETGLPVLKFSVYGAKDEVIFDFMVDAKESKIPNAGMGAFLTFLGARVLKKKCKKRSDVLFSYREHVGAYWGYDDPRVISREPLQAVGTDGVAFSVALAGENVYGEPSNPYILRPLKAGAKGTRRIKLSLACSDNRSLYFEDELEGLNPTKESRGIGHLGLHSEMDYVPAETITFSSLKNHCSMLDLGRYGPFRKQDRKTIQLFDIKSFIFSHEPSAWCFGVEEMLHGQEQMIDITDDLTGEPSEEAKQQIPMYVNEVGHNPSYKQNVIATDDASNRTVKYFIKIEEPMKRNDTVELLVNYKKGYEDIRERKGYGLANLKEGLKGDDDVATRILRNTDERKKMEDSLSRIPRLADLFYLLEWLESVRSELSKKADEFIQKMENVPAVAMDASPPPATKQLIALRRIQWVGGLLRKRLDQLRQQWDEQDNLRRIQGWIPARPVEVDQKCEQWINGFRWESYGRLMNLMARFEDLKDSKGKPIKQDVEQEIVEEACYEIRDRLPRPLFGSLWCNVARQLTIALGLAIGNHVSNSTTNEAVGGVKELLATFMTHAVSAARSIRKDIDRESFDNLVFDAGMHNELKVAFTDWGCFSGFQAPSSFFSDNSTTPKGYTASMIELQAYQDAVELGLEAQVDHKTFRLKCRQSTLVTKLSQSPASRAPTTPFGGREKLLGFPRPLSTLCSKGGAINDTINDTWYLVWQVVYVVDAFTRKFLGQSSFSLDDLCSKVGVDLGLAQYAIERGIRADEDYCKSVSKSEKRQEPRQNKQRKKSLKPKPIKATESAAPRRSSNAQMFWAAAWPVLKDELGWTVEKGNRDNDFYALPTGVQRGKGFRNRVDYFDSVPLVLHFLETDPRWKDKPEVKKSLALYEKGVLLIEELRRTKRLPKFNSKQDMAAYIAKKVVSQET